MSVDLDPRAQEPPDERKEHDVSSMHQQVMREHEEPRDGLEPVPMWFTFLTAGMLFFGGFYLSTFSGGFRSDVFDEQNRGGKIAIPQVEGPLSPTDAVALGRRLYADSCVACHKENGQGQGGATPAPPLADSDWVVGDQASTARLSRILLYGLSGPLTVKTKTGEVLVNGNMPARGGRKMSDREVSAVLTFIRNEWGNKADPITWEDVQKVHAEVGERGPFTQAELLAIKVEKPATPAAPAGDPPK